MNLPHSAYSPVPKQWKRVAPSKAKRKYAVSDQDLQTFEGKKIGEKHVVSSFRKYKKNILQRKHNSS